MHLYGADSAAAKGLHKGLLLGDNIQDLHHIAGTEQQSFRVDYIQVKPLLAVITKRMA